MSDETEIQAFIKKKYTNFDFEVKVRPSDETIMLYIPQDNLGEKAGKKLISIRQLNNLKRKLNSHFSKNSEFIFIQSSSQQDLEAGFFQMLNRKFDGNIISLYTSFHGDDSVDAFLEVDQVNENLQQNIQNHFKKILSDASLKLGVIHWLDSPYVLPTGNILLRVIKTTQPANFDEILRKIHLSYASVSGKWLSNKLDQLRKKGFVKWQKITGTYVLTDKALQVIPAGARRTSSDIERALALGKKKW